jgi:hypothetical protein
MAEIYGPKIRAIAMTALGLYRDLGDAVATLIKEAKKDQGEPSRAALESLTFISSEAVCDFWTWGNEQRNLQRYDWLDSFILRGFARQACQRCEKDIGEPCPNNPVTGKAFKTLGCTDPAGIDEEIRNALALRVEQCVVSA